MICPLCPKCGKHMAYDEEKDQCLCVCDFDEVDKEEN
jgi:ribosomal protein L37E